MKGFLLGKFSFRCHSGQITWRNGSSEHKHHYSLCSGMYLGTLQEFFVFPVEFKGLLEVEVCGGQRDGEVDASYVGQDGVLWQSLQSHTSVLKQRVKVSVTLRLPTVQVFELNQRRIQTKGATCVDEKPPKAFLCWESHLTTSRAEATSPSRV